MDCLIQAVTAERVVAVPIVMSRFTAVIMQMND
jgi:hypothetical protein